MRIAIIGMGEVGSTLGRRWAECGHDVTFCVRHHDDPEKKFEAESLAASIAPVESARDADVILVAVPWHSVMDALETAGDLSGKIILDCTNPVNTDLTELTIGHTTSAGEEIAHLYPRAQVVKIFNTNGVSNMANANRAGHKVTMLYAGDDQQANQIAASLASQIGFEPIELGGLKCARLLEPLAMTWILLARHRGMGRDIALDVIRLPAADSEKSSSDQGVRTGEMVGPHFG